MKFEIKHRVSGAVIFSLETKSLKLCVEAAVKAGANLADANLARANLARANLAGANLADANLARANLADANLARADLARADLAGANLAGADLAAQLGQPNGWHAWTYLAKNGEQRVRVGCQDFTISGGRAYWADKPNRREVLAALDYAEAIGKLRGWSDAATEQDRKAAKGKA